MNPGCECFMLRAPAGVMGYRGRQYPVHLVWPARGGPPGGCTEFERMAALHAYFGDTLELPGATTLVAARSELDAAFDAALARREPRAEQAQAYAQNLHEQALARYDRGRAAAPP